MSKFNNLILVSRNETGGAQSVAIQLKDKLLARGYTPKLRYLFDSSPIKYKKVRLGSFFNLKVFSLFLSLHELIKIRPDVAWGFHPLPNIIICMYAIIFKGKAIPTIHWLPEHQNLILLKFFVYLVRFENVHKIIFVSKTLRDNFIENYKIPREKCVIVYNKLDLNRYDIDCKSDNLNLDFLDRSRKYISFIGRLHQQKNPLFILKLVKSLPDYHFIIAGSGPLERVLREQIDYLGIGSRVNLIGNIDSSTVRYILGISTFYLFPSLYEGHPLSLLEAFAFKCPVVCSNIDANNEMLDNFENCLDDDPLKWVNYIINCDCEVLISHQNKRFDFFNNQCFVDEYVDLINGLV